MQSVETIIKVQFFDLDPMNIVWHGNYARLASAAATTCRDRW
jgi:acyl-CoA thioester hydrolase